MKNSWLNIAITCACGSPQSIENIGYSVMQFSIVRVLSHITEVRGFPSARYQTKAGFTRKSVRTGSQ